MIEQHPITPSLELLEQWEAETAHTTKDETWHVAVQAARWGANQELEACCAIAISDPVCGTKHQRNMLVRHIKEQRRPKPQSLKEQALKAARIELLDGGKNAALIIQALEALPND